MAGNLGSEYDIYATGADKFLNRDSSATNVDYELTDITDIATDLYSEPAGIFEGIGGEADPLALGSGTLTSNLNQAAGVLWNGKSSFTDTTAGYRLGLDTDNELKFFIGDTASSMDWNVTTPDTLTIVGSITASSGTIGGWTINSTSIYTGTEDHSGYTTNAGDITIYSSGTVASIHAKNFYIDTSGNLFCTSATVSGGITTTAGSSLDGQYLSAASVASAATNIALQGWNQTCVFSATDADTVAWGAGSFTASNGTSYAIGASNTGNMVATTYVYLDIAVSTTAYQVTTTATTAIGNGKVLIAVAVNTAGSYATYQVFGGIGGVNLLVNNLVANSASTNEFVSNTAQLANLVVSNAKINDLAVSKLTAGTISSKSILLAVSGGTGDVEIRAGIATGDFSNAGVASGFILGIDDSDSDKAKFYIGDATNNLYWNGSTLAITGTVTATTGTIGGFTIGATTLSAAAGGNTTSLSSGATAFAAGPTGSPTVTITQAGVLTATSATVNGSTISNQDVFGDGSDGDATISGNTTLTTDMYYNDLTITSSSTLNTGGFRIFVKGTLTIDSGSRVARNGNAGSNGGTGADGTAGGFGAGGTLGAGGAALANGSIQGALAGKDGPAGADGVAVIGTASSNGNTGASPSAGTSVAKSLVTADGKIGAAAGAGGNVNAKTGGAAGSASAGGTRTGTVYNTVRNAYSAYSLMDVYPESGSVPVLAALKAAPQNGAGAGSGSGAVQTSSNSATRASSAGGGGGGGNGSNGGIVVIFARTIVNNSTSGISADGGAAGNGGNAGAGYVAIAGGESAAAGGSGGGAGGIGGNGGVVIYVYQSYSGTGTITAAAGAAGTKGLKGTGLVLGGYTTNDGTDGTDGTAGNAGVIIALKV